MREHRCISCERVDEGPNAQCKCMEAGPPCGICGEPSYEPLTPWSGNGHWAEDGHEWQPVATSLEGEEQNDGR